MGMFSGSILGDVLTGQVDNDIASNSMGAGKTEGERRMAGVAEDQANIAIEQWDMYKEVFTPYEKELVQAHQAIIPAQTALDLATISAKQADITGQMPINEELRQQQMRSLKRSEGVEDAFYDEALAGVNVEDRMNAAQADVQQGYDVSTPQMGRQASRMGLNPQGGRFTDAMAKMTYNRAKDIAFARTNARRTADDQNFNRLGQAMGMRGNIAGLSSNTGGQTTNPLNQGMASIGLQKAGQTFQGLAGAQEGFANAAEAKAGRAQTGVSAVGTGIAAFSDERLKTNIQKIGNKHGMPWYSWDWNETATKKFGLIGTQVGHMATDVELKHPNLVILVDGYRTVNYRGLN